MDFFVKEKVTDWFFWTEGPPGVGKIFYDIDLRYVFYEF